MKIIFKPKDRSTRRSRHLAKIVLFVLCLICLLLLIVQWRLVSSTVAFLYKMGRLPPLWSEGSNENMVETYPLNDAKQIAVLLLEQSGQDRRRIIVMYQMYIEVCSWKANASALPSASKLHVLLRLLYDVPEDYPQDQAKFFGGWMSLLVREDGSLTMGVPTHAYGSGTVDLLWPLGYQDGQLVLKNNYFAYSGFPYDGIGEYDYFTSRFALRSVDDLE